MEDSFSINATVSSGIVISATVGNSSSVINSTVVSGAPGTPGTNGVGVPTGGTTNQVLSKIDGTDYNTQWSTPSSTDTTKLAIANNLSDLNSASIARTNLGLGTLATQNGTFSGTSSGNNTGDQTTITGNSGTATKLATARTIGTLTGDVTSAGSTFDGSAVNTNATTLATVNSNIGAFTKASVTVNAKGLVTAVSSGTADFITSLTTTGTTGASSVTAGVLNIPQYSTGGGSAGITRSISTVTSTLTGAAVALVDYVYFLSTGAVFTLPTAMSNTNAYMLKNITTSNMAVSTTSSQTIDGSSLTLQPNATVTLISDNTNWQIGA